MPSEGLNHLGALQRPDRYTGAAIGTYASTVDEWITHYVRPQENANRTDVRWVELANQRGAGLKISAIGPAFGVSATGSPSAA